MSVRRVLVSLLVAVLALVVVGIGVTALLDPYIWPSLFVGIPAGIIAALLAGGVTYWRVGERAGRIVGTPRRRDRPR